MYDLFNNRMKLQGRNMGEVLKHQSDKIMDATFTNDVAYRKCYIQDKDVIFPEQTLAGYKKAKAVFQGTEKYNPQKIMGFEPIDAKYLVHAYYSISGDSVDYYLQFRPLEHGRNPNIRVGSFVFVPDDLGVYNLWLIVARDDRPQFPQFYILKCNLLLKWEVEEKDWPLYEGKHVDVGTYFSWAVQRTQSSYNSGVWMDYYVQTVENQLKAIVPTNSDTNTLTYNERFIISDNPLRRVAWEISKVENTTTFGLTKLTFTQELEFDSIDNVSWINFQSNNFSDNNTGVEYDYYKARTNDNSIHSPIEAWDVETSVISYTGVAPVMKTGGSYKTFTATLYENGEFVSRKPYWRIEYYKNDTLICSVGFIYVNDELVCDNSNSEFIVNKNKIIYEKDNEQLFGIQYVYDTEKQMDLKFKCLQILNMMGGSIVISVCDDPTKIQTPAATLTVEVESL